ncbi:hypothetical protein BpHYR1_054159 [Brachionus plicatilis]|uniref:Uncharacterized protein n=1 Tax=Brachionus plicatilis TaxID=10195 RepID=A0A3M7P926_BRAPC|nr:hypothetical protein BpHYR1_054159 [Brachionus plicatilis]
MYIPDLRHVTFNNYALKNKNSFQDPQFYHIIGTSTRKENFFNFFLLTRCSWIISKCNHGTNFCIMYQLLKTLYHPNQVSAKTLKRITCIRMGNRFQKTVKKDRILFQFTNVGNLEVNTRNQGVAYLLRNKFRKELLALGFEFIGTRCTYLNQTLIVKI